MAKSSHIITTSAVSAALDIPEGQVHQLIRQGHIPHKERLGEVLISAEELLKLLRLMRIARRWVSTFRAGDRVRVYDDRSTFKGTVLGCFTNGEIEVETDAGETSRFWAKQCRRLKRSPKK